MRCSVHILHLSQITLWGKSQSTARRRVTSVNQRAEALSSTVGFVFRRGLTINVMHTLETRGTSRLLGGMIFFSSFPSSQRSIEDESGPLGGSPALFCKGELNLSSHILWFGHMPRKNCVLPLPSSFPLQTHWHAPADAQQPLCANRSVAI